MPIPAVRGLQVNRARLSGDEMTFTFRNDRQVSMNVTINIPQLKRGEEPMQLEFEVPPATLVPAWLFAPPVSLDGLELDLTADFLEIKMRTEAAHGDPIDLGAAFMQISALDFELIEFTSGRIALSPIRHEVPLSLRDSLVEGNYTFRDAQMRLELTNGFGAPMAAEVRLAQVKYDDGSSRSFESALFESPVLLQAGHLSDADRPGREVLVFDRLNSNIVDLLDSRMVGFEFDLSLTLNPEDLDQPFSLRSGRELLVKADLTLSLNASVEGVMVSREMPIDLIALDTLEHLRLKIQVQNGLPVSFRLNLMLSDSGSSDRVELRGEEGLVIASAHVDDHGEVVLVTPTTIYIAVDHDLLLQMLHLNSLHVDFFLKSPSQPPFVSVIKPGQELRVWIGVEAGLR